MQLNYSSWFCNGEHHMWYRKCYLNMEPRRSHWRCSKAFKSLHGHSIFLFNRFSREQPKHTGNLDELMRVWKSHLYRIKNFELSSWNFEIKCGEFCNGIHVLFGPEEVYVRTTSWIGLCTGLVALRVITGWHTSDPLLLLKGKIAKETQMGSVASTLQIDISCVVPYNGKLPETLASQYGAVCVASRKW